MTDSFWGAVLSHLRETIDPDEYRRWFLSSSQASDSGDQISVWVPTAAQGRHISVNYLDAIHRELRRLRRPNIVVRFVATGYGDEEDEGE